MFDTKKMKSLVEPTVKSALSMPWEDKAFDVEYLAQSFYYTSHSTRMLAAAAGKTSVDQQSYYSRCVKHISEENGHDNLALTDFKRLGGQIEDYPELAVTRAFWEPQFVKIQSNPYSLLGYVLCLEYRVSLANPQVYARLKETYDSKSTNFVRVHTEDDPEHVKLAVDQIKALALEDQACVWSNYEQSCRMYVLFLEECLRSSMARGQRAA